MWRRLFGISHPKWHHVHWHCTRPTLDHLGMICSVLLPWEPLQRHWTSVLLQVTAWRWSQRHVSPARWCWQCFSQLCSSQPSLLQVNVKALVSQVMSQRYFRLLHLCVALISCSWGRQSLHKLLFSLGEGCFRAVILQKTKLIPMVWELMSSRNP